MKDAVGISGDGYSDATVGHVHTYLLPAVETILIRHFSSERSCEKRILVHPTFEWVTAEDSGISPPGCKTSNMTETVMPHAWHVRPARDPAENQHATSDGKSSKVHWISTHGNPGWIRFFVLGVFPLLPSR
jgi:hypothetical protein